VCGFKKPDKKSKVVNKKWFDGRLMATTIQVASSSKTWRRTHKFI